LEEGDEDFACFFGEIRALACYCRTKVVKGMLKELGVTEKFPLLQEGKRQTFAAIFDWIVQWAEPFHSVMDPSFAPWIERPDYLPDELSDQFRRALEIVGVISNFLRTTSFL
jgi:hypothetical protein